MESELAKARRASAKADRAVTAANNKAVRLAAKAATEKTKAEAKKAREKTANARKELGFAKAELRTGTKRARTTLREGNKGCRTTRRDADAPHRARLSENKIDYNACRDVVAGNTWKIIADEVIPFQPEVERLSALIPPRVASASAARNQERWTQRVEEARNDLAHQNPQLAATLDQFLDPLARYGSPAARRAREASDRLVHGRPAMSLAEYVAQRAHEGGGEMERAAESAAQRSVRRFMEAGPPSSVAARLARSGPSSAAPPSRVTPSMLTFGAPSSRRQSAAEQILSGVTSSRRGAASARATPSRRGAASARGEGPASRSPRTVASPGSSPPEKRRKPRKPREKRPEGAEPKARKPRKKKSAAGPAETGG